MRIEIDGNDGTGKSTLVRQLGALGIDAKDRGRLTKATDDDGVQPEEGVKYVILDTLVRVSQDRLLEAGKDLTEKYHTEGDLTHYRERFLQLAPRFKATVVDSNHPPRTVLQHALAAILESPLRIGLPKGRLQDDVATCLRGAGYPATIRGRNLHPLMGPGFNALLLKPRAIPFMIGQGLLDVAFSGRDLVLESTLADRIDVLTELGLHNHRVKLCAASDRKDILTNPPTRPLVVATEYPNLTDQWLTELNLSHVCIQTYGSTECFVPDFADLIVDVVETGRTLADNGLHTIHTFGTTETVLVARKGIKERADVRALVQGIQAVIAERTEAT